jgi:hypothetical protein
LPLLVSTSEEAHRDEGGREGDDGRARALFDVAVVDRVVACLAVDVRELIDHVPPPSARNWVWGVEPRQLICRGF